jgi:hypothetical protein
MPHPYNTAPQHYQPTRDYPFPLSNVGEGRFVLRKHNNYSGRDFFKFALDKGTVHTPPRTSWSASIAGSRKRSATPQR